MNGVFFSSDERDTVACCRCSIGFNRLRCHGKALVVAAAPTFSPASSFFRPSERSIIMIAMACIFLVLAPIKRWCITVLVARFYTLGLSYSFLFISFGEVSFLHTSIILVPFSGVLLFLMSYGTLLRCFVAFYILLCCAIGFFSFLFCDCWNFISKFINALNYKLRCCDTTLIFSPCPGLFLFCSPDGGWCCLRPLRRRIVPNCSRVRVLRERCKDVILWLHRLGQRYRGEKAFWSFFFFFAPDPRRERGLFGGVLLACLEKNTQGRSRCPTFCSWIKKTVQLGDREFRRNSSLNVACGIYFDHGCYGVCMCPSRGIICTVGPVDV